MQSVYLSEPKISVVLSRLGDNNTISSLDLTRYLSDQSSIRVSKSVRQPAGTFKISFPDQPTGLGSVYDWARPMDMVEIRMSNSVDDRDDDGRLPIILRGFINDVERGASMADGKPMRMVTLTGLDYGKIIQLIQLLYLPIAQTDGMMLRIQSWYLLYAKGAAYKIKTVSEFIADALNYLINPFLAEMHLPAKLKPDDLAVINAITPDIRGLVGLVNPYTPNSFTDVSLYELMKIIVDAPVFNEFYTEDTPGGVSLVVRPVPFKDLNGTFIQGSADESVLLTADIIDFRGRRTDTNVANYYQVTSSRLGPISQETERLIAASGNKETFISFDYPNSARDTFGIRKMSAETVLNPPDNYLPSDAPNEELHTQNKDYLTAWIIKRRLLLMAMNKDNAVLESGNLTVRGNPKIKAGTYLKLYDGKDSLGECYAHGVTHEFSPFRSFLTKVDYDRGTFYAVKAK